MSEQYDAVVDIQERVEVVDAEDYEYIRPLWKDILLEYFGTLTFVYISLAGVNQAVLSAGSGAVDQVHVALCFTLGLTAGIIVAGQSGGHLNPAVSLTMYATDSNFNAKRLLGYIVAQVYGGFTAGLLVISVYYSWINNLKDPETSIGSFGTLKNDNNSLFSAILDQFIGSALLMLGAMMTSASWYKPITVGTILGGLGLFQGTNGFAFNLARDFGPRAASAVVFGTEPFTAADYWFWVPAVIPFFGIPFGWGLHKVLSALK